MNDHINKLYTIAKLFPSKPGIYQFIDKNGNFLYIGKAKNLRNRILSYFNQQGYKKNKINLLLNKTFDIQNFMVDSESEAFILENSLIKKHQPKYNIQLKDDKTYPWICIKKERFPRVFYTRNIINDGSEYFGPYTSMKTVKTVLELIRKLYPIRTCKYNLTENAVKNKKYKKCLEFHIGNCKGPCEGQQTEDEYMQNISEIQKILNGNIQDVIQYLEQIMHESAKKLEYEKAEEIRQKIQIIKSYHNKSKVANPKIHNVDVFTIVNEINEAFVNYLKIINGTVVQVYTVEIKKKLDERVQDIFPTTILRIREQLKSKSNEIILSEHIDFEIPNIKITVPKCGDKKKLIELSNKNLLYFKSIKIHQREELKERKHKNYKLESLKKHLQLDKLPEHIECFDNSNIQGKYPVAACVVFRNGKPSKKEYRKFHIKSVEGPDDFASMEEVVYRRYHRVLSENIELPDLIVIDGGKGQLNAAFKSLKELNIEFKIKIIAIAKRLDEIFQIGDPYPIYINKNSESLKILQHLRDEAHRFGITFHRNTRSKQTYHSELQKIVGIGHQTAQKLLKYYKTIESIRSKEMEQLQQIIGRDKAIKVYQYFNK